jgi:ketosteroid isomerase-like protein
MSEKDVEMVRNGYATLARDGVESMLEFVHPDFEMTTPAALSAEPDTYSGREGMRRYWAGFDGGMEDVQFIPGDLEDLGGGRVLSVSVLRGRGRTTGIEVEQQIVLVWEVRDEMAYRIGIFATVEEARASLSDDSQAP